MYLVQDVETQWHKKGATSVKESLMETMVGFVTAEPPPITNAWIGRV